MDHFELPKKWIFLFAVKFQLILWTKSFSNWSHIAVIDGIVQDYSNSSVLAMELLQSCPKPS